MRNILLYSILLILVIAGIVILYHPKDKSQVAVEDFKNISYVIGGQSVKLTDGVAETPAAPDSSSKIVTRFFGNEIRKDLDGDGREDVAFILTEDTGGSGLFYYVAAALNKQSGNVGVDGVFLGDRIAPQTTESGPGRSIIVNYADRPSGAPMTESPSVGKSMRLIVDPETLQFAEVADNFEGEANPDAMTLGMKTWSWQNSVDGTGVQSVPKAEDKFKLTFNSGGNFSASTDCNGIGGTYKVDGSSIKFSDMVSTMMYCEGSEEGVFKSGLSAASEYKFTSKGELILSQKGGGSMTFK